MVANAAMLLSEMVERLVLMLPWLQEYDFWHVRGIDMCFNREKINNLREKKSKIWSYGRGMIALLEESWELEFDSHIWRHCNVREPEICKDQVDLSSGAVEWASIMAELDGPAMLSLQRPSEWMSEKFMWVR